MKTVSLSGSPRENVGKKDAAKLRRAGQVPAVLYGSGEQTHFSINEIAIGKIVFTPDIFKVILDLDGKKVEAVIQDLQWHPVTDRIIHIDFLELVEGKVVSIPMPVQLAGNSIGVRNGGKLRVNFRTLTLRGLPTAFPDAVAVDISEMRIGTSIRVGDIELEGVEILEPKEAVVVAVKASRGAVDEDGEEEEDGEAEAAPAEGAEG